MTHPIEKSVSFADRINTQKLLLLNLLHDTNESQRVQSLRGLIQIGAGTGTSFFPPVEECWNIAFREALPLTRGVPDAEDAAQEAMITMITKGRTIRNESPLGWIKAVTRSRVYDLGRKRRSKPELLVSEYNYQGDKPSTDPLDNPVVVSERSEDKIQIELAVKHLSPLHQEIINLRYSGGLGYDEIALRLGISCGTVKSRLSRAHANLAQMLKEYR